MKPHILMITNHGIHQWDVIPGLPDTGGQNVFVNQFTDILAKLGFKITIVNRGGYAHPKTGEMHTGLHIKDENQRILYIEDGKKEFVRKEDMDEQIPELVNFLKDFLIKEDTKIDLIISHYWDAAKIGVLLNEKLPKKIKHVWVPHSLGSVKKRNMNPETWKGLRVDKRIENEKTLIDKLDGIASTSSVIKESLKNDYNYETSLFLPPCIDTDRFFVRDIDDNHDIWAFLQKETGLDQNQIKKCKIITEISRTDNTKRKDILIQAFAEVYKKHPDTLLVVSIDDTEKELSARLKRMINDLGISTHVATIGNEWERLPFLYSITAVYCSPSVMEGFGMAVQEAAATKVPVVGSDKIPFVKEYLLGKNIEKDGPVTKGEGAFMIEADNVSGFANAFEILLKDESLRKTMGEVAYNITIPYFTWKIAAKRFLKEVIPA